MIKKILNLFSRQTLLMVGATGLVLVGGGSIAAYRTFSAHNKKEPVVTQEVTANTETGTSEQSSTGTSKTDPKPTEAKKSEPSKPATKSPTSAPSKSSTKPATGTAPSTGGGSAPQPSAPSQPPAGCPNGTHTPGGSNGSGGCWPYAGNTGVPAGTALSAYTGPCSIQGNTTITNKVVNCALQMYNNSSLTIKNSIVNGFIENTYTNGTGKLLIEDSEIHAGAWSEGAAWGSSMTITRTELTGGQHSVHCENDCTVTDSWLHSQYNPTGGSYHNNAFISNGGTNMYLRGNTLHCTAILNATDGGCTGDMTLLGDFDTISYVTGESNLFMANNSSISYCFYGGWTPGKPYPNGHHVAMRNNIFQRGANGKCGVYGAVTSFQTTAPGNEWTNNRWSDGAVVSP